MPIAWLLSRSITGPMRRLAQAARDLPTSTSERPLPIEGPTEVKILTERFNAMAHEMASTRHEETQMLANLRHDLRTPLTSIGGFAEAIADGTASGDRASAAARTIAEEAQRLERLVGELGVVERLREGPAALRPEILDATKLLVDAAARFEGPAATPGVAIEVQVPPPASPS
jgi:two-component system OmpR family sensor kinase